MRCVVDTNVATTANRLNKGASEACAAASGRALQAIMDGGHVFIDTKRLMIEEYNRNLGRKGQAGPGTAFLKWLLTHEWSASRVTQVPITPRARDPEDFEELPPPSAGVRYDRSDRKFLAVAAAHPEHPPILQSFDSKWWGWQKSLAASGVKIHFLCPGEIAKKHIKKMGR